MKKTFTALLAISVLQAACNGKRSSIADPAAMQSAGFSTFGSSTQPYTNSYSQTKTVFDQCVQACQVTKDLRQCQDDCYSSVYDIGRGYEYDENLQPLVSFRQGYGLSGLVTSLAKRDPDRYNLLSRQYFGGDRGGMNHWRSRTLRDAGGMEGVYCDSRTYSDCPENVDAYYFTGMGQKLNQLDRLAAAQEDESCPDDKLYTYYLDYAPPQASCTSGQSCAPSMQAGGGINFDLSAFANVGTNIVNALGNAVAGIAGRVVGVGVNRLEQATANIGGSFGHRAGQISVGAQRFNRLSQPQIQNSALALRHWQALGPNACQQKYSGLPGYQVACTPDQCDYSTYQYKLDCRGINY